eukprot:m.251872 g.251872  ORF g.251872 m.251872 type:complete len:305 (+) comp16151_c1_seq12:134-1048(+)
MKTQGRKRRRICVSKEKSEVSLEETCEKQGSDLEEPSSFVASSFEMTKLLGKHLHKEGYLVVQQFLSKRGLEYLKRKVDTIYNTLSSRVHKEWVLSLHQMLPHEENWMWRLATEPKLLDIVESLLGEDIVLFSTQLANKPPNSGTVVPWHQDGDKCLTVWIPLDDVDEENGTLKVIPKGHNKGRRKYATVSTEKDVNQFEFFHQYHLYASVVTDAEIKKAVTIRIRGGGLEAHNPLTPHSSDPNTSKTRHRRAIILRYQPASEPLQVGDLEHWENGSTFKKQNFLVRGSHSSLKLQSRDQPLNF